MPNKNLKRDEYTMDFLAFESFISIKALIVFYYCGVFVMPFFAWHVLKWITQQYKIIDITYQIGKDKLWSALSKEQKIKLVVVSIVFFLFMELFWRMLFEFLIAYMQIRDALV